MLSSHDFPGKKPAENEHDSGTPHADLSARFRKPSDLPFHGGGGFREIITLDLFPALSIKSIDDNVADMDLNYPQPQVAEPLSIVYKGEMHVLDVPAEKARQIVRFANLQISGCRGTKAGVMEPMSTIYQGEVNVFIDVPAAKGKGILDFARVSAQGRYKCLSAKPSNIRNHTIVSSRSPCSSSVAPNHTIQEEPLNARYLPMERKYWMQRFVQRRKERITEKTPYQKGYYS